MGFRGRSDGNESAYKIGNLGWIPEPRRPLEMGMAMHSSILVWRIPWTEELGGLRSMGHKESDEIGRAHV